MGLDTKTYESKYKNSTEFRPSRSSNNANDSNGAYNDAANITLPQSAPTVNPKYGGLGTENAENPGFRNIGAAEAVNGLYDAAMEAKLAQLRRAYDRAIKQRNTAQTSPEAAQGAQSASGRVDGLQVIRDVVNGRTGVEGTQTVNAVEEQKNNAPGRVESTAVNTNPAQHTPVEQKTIDEYRASVDNSVLDFIKSGEHLRIPITKRG